TKVYGRCWVFACTGSALALIASARTTIAVHRCEIVIAILHLHALWMAQVRHTGLLRQCSSSPWSADSRQVAVLSSLYPVPRGRTTDKPDNHSDVELGQIQDQLLAAGGTTCYHDRDAARLVDGLGAELVVQRR